MAVVYNIEDKKVKIQAFLNFLQPFTPFLPAWHQNPDGNFTLVDSSKNPSKTEKLISNRFYFFQSWLNKKKNIHKTYNRLQFVRDILKRRNLTKELLEKALVICSDSLKMLQAKGSNGKTNQYEGYAKGTKRYNKIQQGKILDFVEARKQEGKDCFFLTLTCDVKKYASRSDAWENYVEKEVHPVTENLRKHYGAEYVGTLESTANGYPHIHMMLFFPHNTFPEFKHYHNKQKIRKGHLFDMVKAKVNSQVFDLEAAKGQNLKWYLCKYIGKGIEESIFSLLDKKEAWNESDLKQVQEFIYLTAFGRRKVLMSHKKSKKSKVVQKKEDSFKDKEFESLVHSIAPEGSASVVKKYTEKEYQDQVRFLLKRINQMSPDHAAKLRGNLTSLCTNSPSWKDVHVESMSFRNYVTVFHRVPGRNDDVSEEDTLNFHWNSRLMFHSRNFIEDIMKFVINPEGSAINRMEWINEDADVSIRLFGKYHFSDDKAFLKAFFVAFCSYVEFILLRGVSYMELLRERVWGREDCLY